jgi:hypothetical protein
MNFLGITLSVLVGLFVFVVIGAFYLSGVIEKHLNEDEE